MPDYSSELFFFSLQSSHRSVHFLEKFLKPPKAKSGQGKLSPKCPLSFFTFSRKPTKPGVPKGSPFRSLIFCNRMYVNKSKRVPPFTFFGTMRHFSKEKNSKISSFFSKKNVLRFLSLTKLYKVYRSYTKLYRVDIAPTSDVLRLFRS